MPSLNRFPLLGLWAREAAHRIGYSDAEADVLGHAYDTVQTRDLRVIYFDVRAATNLSYAGFCLGQ